MVLLGHALSLSRIKSPIRVSLRQALHARMISKTDLLQKCNKQMQYENRHGNATFYETMCKPKLETSVIYAFR